MNELREAFRMDTWRGRLAVVSAVLILITPTLATYVSTAFLVLLVVAVVLSLASVSQSGGKPGTASTPLARAGYAMAVNGVLLIVALFIDGFLSDFIVDAPSETVTTRVGIGFTTVHILLGIGLLIVDDQRHARRSDI